MRTICGTIVVAVMMTAAWGHAALPKVADAQERVPPGKAVEARLIDGIRSRLAAGRKDITIKKGCSTLQRKEDFPCSITLSQLMPSQIFIFKLDGRWLIRYSTCEK